MWGFIEYLIIILVPVIFIGLGIAFFKSQKNIRLQAELATGKKAAKKAPGDYILAVIGVIFLLILIFAIGLYVSPLP